MRPHTGTLAIVLLALMPLAGTARAEGPSFDCAKAEAGSIERRASITGSAVYVCDGQPANEVRATYFATDPPTAIAERGDQVSLMCQQPSGSGAKYQGRNEMIWEHQGEAMISWDMAARRCAAR